MALRSKNTSGTHQNWERTKFQRKKFTETKQQYLGYQRKKYRTRNQECFAPFAHFIDDQFEFLEFNSFYRRSKTKVEVLTDGKPYANFSTKSW